MNKRAQYFLIAALILSGIILTFGKIYVSSKIEKEDVKVYDLSKEIEYESSQVIDNGIFEQKSQGEVKDDLKNLTAYYSELHPDSDIDVVFGNSSALSLIEYNLTAGKINELPISIGGVQGEGASFSSENQKLNIKISTSGQNSKTIERNVNLNGEQTFYLVVRKKVRGQDVIVYR